LVAGVVERVRGLWRGDGGARSVLTLALPLVLSMMSVTLQHFIDRMFLTWWSAEAVAGATAGGFAIYILTGLCGGTAEYSAAFVSQYVGAGRPERIGRIVFQASYFALFAGLVGFGLSFGVSSFFDAVGHPEALRVHEVAYSRVMLTGLGPMVLMIALSAYFAGRGRTIEILIVNVMVTALNMVFDWLLIFGRLGFPEMGTTGAAWATVGTQTFGAMLYIALIVRSKERRAHGFHDYQFRGDLFRRLMRLGVPSGLQPSLEILAFALFMFVLGSLGTGPLAATSLAFNLNALVFLPAIGLGYGVSTLVARHLGENRPGVAERTVKSGLVIAEAYMIVCSLAYVGIPRVLLAPYGWGADPAVFTEVRETAVVLLRFVAFYSIFDMVNVVCAAGLKGAGDTRFPMFATVIISWFFMLFPTWWFCVRGDHGVYVAWAFATLYVVLLGLTMFVRYRLGAWKQLRVIETDLLREATA
jgi:MATE family multidrug resistance protein